MEEEPTVISIEDVDRVVKMLMVEDIKLKVCLRCSVEYLQSYGDHLMECDECFFKRFPKDVVEAFCLRLLNQ